MDLLTTAPIKHLFSVSYCVSISAGGLKLQLDMTYVQHIDLNKDKDSHIVKVSIHTIHFTAVYICPSYFQKLCGEATTEEAAGKIYLWSEYIFHFC